MTDLVHSLLYSVVLGLVTYRVSRFIVLDTLIDEPRNAVIAWLEMRRRFRGVAAKLTDLLSCPWCITVWVAAGAVAITYPFVESVPLPAWTWLGSATVALVVWAVADSE